jgi:aerobic carbon-monoxide dehydrogenase medium subunit
MTDIHYVSPRTLDEAVSAFAAAGSVARILAGGTDLLVQMRSGAVKPGLIVDIKKIAEMTAIEEAADGSFRVGAAVPGAVLAEHPRFGQVWPGVLEAVNLIGSTQVQGRASAGGNLCNGSPAADSVPAMIAAGAIATEMDIAVVGCGVSLTLKDGVCTAARVGLGAVAPTVLLVEAAAKALIGSQLDDAALNAAAAACSAACRPIDDKRGTIIYRTKVAGVLLRRTAAIAAKRATGN